MSPENGVAIVGMSCRLPGARNLEEFWQLLRDGREGISFFSKEELLPHVPRSLLDDTDYVRARGVLAGADLFDADFFGFSPREAELLDPQHRVFFECAWAALEDAGYLADTYSGLIGVFAGAGMNTYLLNNLATNPGLIDALPGTQAVIASEKDHLPTHTSYKLGLTGPSVNVQTACSTSLVAVHLACQSLLAGECDMVLAGGVSIAVPLQTGYLFQDGGILSPDGHCRTFDVDAAGTVGGNGAGVVILKRLDDATAAGDSVYAVIRGSAINNDGSTKVGYTAPSVTGQAEVIATALAVAEADAETISYVEAHGTGTYLGDPVEIAALTQAFGEQTERRGFCAIGSVKTNLGHLDAAAGVAGLIKTALALRHRQIPPSLNFSRPNPEIDFANSPFYVNTSLTDWTSESAVLRAGVSSFGIGGSNAHVVVEEAPARARHGADPASQIIVLSARTASALEVATVNIAERLSGQPDGDLADIAHTLAVGRRRFACRRFATGNDAEQVAATLTAMRPDDAAADITGRTNTPVTFLFPGQGAQRVRMAAGTFHNETLFRETVRHCCGVLEKHLGFDLCDLIYPASGAEDKAARRLDETENTQPALFVVEFALATLWMDWGVHPRSMIGHSIGEYVAACLAGVFALDDALAVVAARGKLIQRLPRGAMVIVPLSPDRAQAFLDDELQIAAHNEPSISVLAGPIEAVRSLEARLRAAGLSGRRLRTSHAFHSRMMDEIVEDFVELLAGIDLRPPTIPFISNVTGTWITPEAAADPESWGRHLCQTVLFEPGLQELFAQGEGVLLDVGPGRSLAAAAKRHADRPEGVEVISASGRTHADHADHDHHDHQDDHKILLDALGRVWLAGVDVDWEAFYATKQRARVSLPTYPFERQKYWIDPADTPSRNRQPRHDRGKYEDLDRWFYQPSWKRTRRLEASGDSLRLDAEFDQRNAVWMVFSDSSGLGLRIIAGLEDADQRTVQVVPGRRFARVSERCFHIDPARAGDYLTLLETVSAEEAIAEESGGLPLIVLHLWGVGEPEATGTDFDTCVQNLGFHSLLYLARAIDRQPSPKRVRIGVAADGLHEVLGTEQLQPAKATVLASCRVIPQEYPELSCRLVDVGSASRTDWEGADVAQLLEDLLADSPDVAVAYRNGWRWTQIYEPAPPPLPSSGASAIRDGGAYVVVGGLGGVGLESAAALAAAVPVRLALVGRSNLPPPDDWDHWLETHDDEISLKIRKIRSIEALGSEVAIFSADVTDDGEMHSTLRDIAAKMGQIRGLVHAAGAAKRAHWIRDSERSDWSPHLDVKRRSLAALESALEGHQPDFCAVHSSLSSILGAAGRVGYAAAHAFVDAFCRRRNREPGCRWICINWDNWLTWKEPEAALAGGAADLFMTSDEAATAFLRILNGQGSTEVVVSTGDLQARIEQWIGLDFAARRDSSERTSSHQRPSSSTAFVAPTTSAERTLATIWEQVLGFSQVGIDDSFFDLGGDSVLGLLVASKARQAGYRITPAQIFENDTVAELARAAEPTQGRARPEPAATGSAPLTPIQRWFFDQELARPERADFPALVELRGAIEAPRLERALQHVTEHHDALRLRFVSESGKLTQVYADEASSRLRIIDIGDADGAAESELIAEVFAELRAGLCTTTGPLWAAALIDRGDRSDPLLCWTVHHLVGDLMSWTILLEDLESAYEQLGRHETVELPAKTTSYGRWATLLETHARSSAVRDELPYWLSIDDQAVGSNVPTDFPQGVGSLNSSEVVKTTLTVDQTQRLLHDARGAYGTNVQEVLLTALAMTFSEWTGSPSLLVGIEGHGREELEGVDLSRTVGWFTSRIPVALDLRGHSGAKEMLKTVKEQLRAVPGTGSGFGLLRYLADDADAADRLRRLPAPQVSFVYVGGWGHGSSSRWCRRLEAPAAGASGPRGPRSALLQVMAGVAEEQLFTRWGYSVQVHRRQTIDRLATRFIRTLESIIAHCGSPEAGGYTPSDFPDADLTQDELDEFIENIERPRESMGD